jgi:hypothetical protein
MNEVAKYARTILNGIEKRPQMWGNNLAVELQYLTAMEFLAISEGFDIKVARDAYARELKNTFRTAVLPASSYDDKTIEEIIDILKRARVDVDPSLWVDMTGV